MPTIGPTWSDKLDILTRGLEWATGVSGVWKFQHEAFQAPQANDPWFELRMMRVFAIGNAEVVNAENIDPNTGLPDVTNPRKEIAVSQKEIRCDMRVFGRDQQHDVVAWVIADQARTRMRMPYFTDEFLNRQTTLEDTDDVPSANLAIVELFDIVPMPPPQEVISNRWQSEAMFEMRLSTSTAEDDPAAVGAIIEAVEITSNLLQPDGVTPLDPSIQLTDELIDAR